MLKKLTGLIAVVSLLSFACTAYSDEKMHLGEIKIEQLLTNYPSFQKQYQAFEVNHAEKEELAKISANINVKVFFGSWCHDSQREVPRLAKLVEGNPNFSIKYYGLDFNKRDPDGLAESHGVKYTPTIIFYVDNQEIGKIIEKPDTSLYQEIRSIVSTTGG